MLSVRFSRLRVALWASLTLMAFSFFYEVAEIAGVFSLSYDPEAELTFFEGLYGLLGVVMIIVGVTTIVMWCMWLHRATKNIAEADFADFEYSPAWAVGWHFVPFANLIKPFEVMRKIWNASVGQQSTLDQSAPIINRWWISWLISGIAGNISARILFQAEAAETLYFGVVLVAISSVASFVAIPTALVMLQSITEGQSKRFG